MRLSQIALPKSIYGNGAVDKTLSVQNTMKRLSLEELKAQKANQVNQNLEKISGGDTDWCHVWDILTTPDNWFKAIASGPGPFVVK